MATEAGAVTGTKDKDYDVIRFVEQSLSNALSGDLHRGRRARRRLGARRVLQARAVRQRKGGEQGRELLRKRLVG